MLKKLLKYDLKWSYKELIIFYALALIFSVIGRSLSYIQNSVIFSIITGIIYGITIGMLIGCFINCILRIWSRFIKNLYQDESYLTHTLPVASKTVYTSKVLAAIITIFTTVVVCLVCLLICYYSEENMQALKSMLEIVASTYNTTMLNIVFLIAGTFLVEAVFIVLIGYIGIIIGHRANKNKIVNSVIIGFAFYMITRIITLILVSIFGLLNPDIMNLINTTENIDVNIIKYLLGTAIALYVVYNIFYYWLGKKQLAKGVNID